MTRVLLSGCGRMGRRIAALASETDDIEIVGGLEDPGSKLVGLNLWKVFHLGEADAVIWSAANIEKAVAQTAPDVLVDFTNADASTANVTQSASLGLRIVMGTTGHSEEQMKQILSAVGRAGVAAVISPNMSAGVTALLEACEVVAKMLPTYDVEVVEVHHNQKLDAPSGTALKIAGHLAEALGRDPSGDLVLGRSGKGRRGVGEIGVAALRGGDVVGDHTVMFVGVGERIEIIHRAQSRDAFASGVIRSIRFVSTADPGVYSIRDLLSGN